MRNMHTTNRATRYYVFPEGTLRTESAIVWGPDDWAAAARYAVKNRETLYRGDTPGRFGGENIAH